MDSLPSQSVAIDGLSVRRIREEKRLTQLYVAKVVGVTTDTVSRWENNRYPTIRRDNALHLAEALEVELDAILKDEKNEAEECDPGSDSVTAAGKIKRPAVIASLCVLILLVGLFFWKQLQGARPAFSATRIVPAYAAPGSHILIQIKVSSHKDLKGMILKETFPRGWQLIESLPVASSVSDHANGARWIFRNPDREMSVFYMVKVASNAAAKQAHIDGEVIANPDGRHSTVALKNPTTMTIAPYHWADTNANQVIDDLEILEVSNLTERTGTLDLGWDQIEEIWEAGRYRWREQEERFVAVDAQAD